jgi:hypothetical protein
MLNSLYIWIPDVVLREEDPDGGLLFNPDTNQIHLLNRSTLQGWRSAAWHWKTIYYTQASTWPTMVTWKTFLDIMNLQLYSSRLDRELIGRG